MESYVTDGEKGLGRCSLLIGDVPWPGNHNGITERSERYHGFNIGVGSPIQQIFVQEERDYHAD